MKQFDLCPCGHVPKMIFKHVGKYMVYSVFCEHCKKQSGWASTKQGAIDLFYNKEKTAHVDS